jgi:hypothetical protein
MISVQRDVSVPGPQLKALLEENKPLLVSDLIAHPDQRQERQTFRYAHVLGSGLSPDAVESWQLRHPDYRLPTDLAAFLSRVDGVHLWADLATSRAYFGILPLSEWLDAKDVDWAMMFESPPVGQLAISYHENGDYFLVLDTRRRKYLWYDLQDFDEPKPAGDSVSELLDFWWQETAWLDPRRDEVAG